MRKTAIITLDAHQSDKVIIRKLQPFGDKILDVSIATKPGKADVLLIHYDDDNGLITDAALEASIRN